MTTPNPPTADPARPAYDEQAALAYVRQLADLERDGARNHVVIGPYSLFCLIGALQLALRHPNMTGGPGAQVRDLVEQWRVPFDGTPGEPLIDMGYDPACDGDGLPNGIGTFDVFLAAIDASVAKQVTDGFTAGDMRAAWDAGRASVPPPAPAG